VYQLPKNMLDSNINTFNKSIKMVDLHTFTDNHQ